MNPPSFSKRHQFRILQKGTLPLRPNRRIQRVEHRCTAALVWPVGEAPTAENSVLTDPCFTRLGHAEAESVSRELGIDLYGLRYFFETHAHHDHLLHFPDAFDREGFVPLSSLSSDDLPGLYFHPCPGHSPDLHALVFQDESGRLVWIVGDAVLDHDWLVNWGFYWPNFYEPEEIIQTWQSLGQILGHADVIVPGHGEPIEVTPLLLADLCNNYHLAEYGEKCPEVLAGLEKRLGVS